MDKKREELNQKKHNKLLNSYFGNYIIMMVLFRGGTLRAVGNVDPCSIQQTDGMMISQKEHQRDLVNLCGLMIGKYTWMDIEGRSIFFKIVDILEVGKSEEIDPIKTKARSSRIYGCIKFRDQVLSVFDYRSQCRVVEDDDNSDKLVIAEMDHYGKNFIAGILFKNPEDVFYFANCQC
jgi:chemotaxis signal transduction protein